MKKTITRILALLLCVMAFAAVLPAPALAADKQMDEAAPAADRVAAAVNAKVCTKTYKLGKVITFKAIPSHPAYEPRYQWQRKGVGRSRWVDIKKATKRTYTFKVTTGKDGYTFRCKITYKLLPAEVKPEYTREIRIKVKK